jgi:hypothetical protein
VRRLLANEVGRLRFRCNKTKDPALGAELDRLQTNWQSCQSGGSLQPAGQFLKEGG